MPDDLAFSVSIESVALANGGSLRIPPNSVLVVVGPNNSGKTTFLSEIWQELHNPSDNPRIVKGIKIATSGDGGDFKRWVKEHMDHSPNPTAPNLYSRRGQGIHLANAYTEFRQYVDTNCLRQFAQIFARMNRTSQLAELVNPPVSIPFTKETPTHPIQVLYRYPALEQKFSAMFRQAFGMDLVVHRGAGNTIPLYCGERPTKDAGEDEYSISYLRKIEALEEITVQGDGVRSFLGCLFELALQFYFVVLLDEPDVFLHPPQMRLLGRLLATIKNPATQVLISTHSSDLLVGVLDSPTCPVKIVRISGPKGATRIDELNPEDVLRLWQDPILRHSNILSGLFHEHVVVCEGDADCRFYAAVTDAIYDGLKTRRPDIQFVHGSTKNRIPQIVRALRGIGVPVSVIADIDLLADLPGLTKIVTVVGGNWLDLEQDLNILHAHVSSKHPELLAGNVRLVADQVLGALKPDKPLPKQSIDQLRGMLKESTTWGVVKLAGISYFKGEVYSALLRILAKLESSGVYVLRVGELEGFCRSIGEHGPAWVSQVITKDLQHDSELEIARKFLASLISERVDSTLKVN